MRAPGDPAANGQPGYGSCSFAVFWPESGSLRYPAEQPQPLASQSRYRPRGTLSSPGPKRPQIRSEVRPRTPRCSVRIGLVLLVLLQVPIGGRTVSGGTQAEQRLYGEVGRGHPLFDTGEFWVEKGLVVFLSRSPSSCSAHTLELSQKVDPEIWYNLLRFIEETLPASTADRQLLMQKPMLMLVQAPSGASCGWRLLDRGGENWTSVAEMKASRTIASCADAIDALRKAGLSKENVEAVRSVLSRPRSLSDCARPKKL